MIKIFSFLVCQWLFIGAFSQDCGTIIRNIDLGGNEDVWHTATSKDGFIYISGTSYNGNGTQSPFLVKTDTLGSVIWSRKMSYGTDSANFRKIIPTKDSGCITVGYSSQLHYTQLFSGWVVKWDKNGVKQWSRCLCLNSKNGDMILGGIETSDGGYLFTGIIDAGGLVAWATAVKTNNQGALEWMQIFDLPLGFEFQGATEIGDGYILCGEYLETIENNGNFFTVYRPLITKVNKLNGNVIFNVSYTYNEGILITNGELKGRPGGYFMNMAIIDQIQGKGTYKHVVSYIDSNFNVQKTLAISYPVAKSQSNIMDMAATPDGGFVAGLGGLGSGNDADLYKIDANGQFVWKKKYGGPLSQHISGVTAIGSNNYVFAGSNQKSNNVRDILWIRTFVGAEPTDCNFNASDATVGQITINKIDLAFDNVFSFVAWEAIAPIYESFDSDVHSITYTCGFDCSNNVLPLKIRNINVDNTAGNAVVNWTTENEKNVAKIALLKSYNGTDFEEVDSFNPKGSVTNHYTFVDKNIPQNKRVLFYKVAVINHDGSKTFSKIVSVNINGSVDFVQIIPNPNRGSFSLQIQSKEPTELVNLEIYDQSGRVLFNQNDKLARGNNSILIELKNTIQSGIYFLSISGLHRQEVKKIYITN